MQLFLFFFQFGTSTVNFGTFAFKNGVSTSPETSSIKIVLPILLLPDIYQNSSVCVTLGAVHANASETWIGNVFINYSSLVSKF